MHWKSIGLAVVLLGGGCDSGPSPLEQAALRLGSGMRRIDVEHLLSAFRVVSASNEVLEINRDATLYSTNREAASWILYAPQEQFTLESLKVYFDSKSNLLGKYYTPRG